MPKNTPRTCSESEFRKLEPNVRRLSHAQIYALHIGAHYRLHRSSMGWWAVDHPRWDVTEPVYIISPVTIKSLWRIGLLDGSPDEKILGHPIHPGSSPELWTNDRGKNLLAWISSDTGIFFDLKTDQLIWPDCDEDHFSSVAIH
jgi:hypothetical protein